MSLLEAQRKYLTTRMRQVVTGIPMALPNLKFNKPEDSAWGEFHIMGGDPITIGSEGEGKKRVRYVHMLQMTIWIPDEGGSQIATLAGDSFSGRFANRQGRDPEGQLYRFDSIQPMTSTRTAQGWYASVFRIAYTRDAIENIDAGLTL